MTPLATPWGEPESISTLAPGVFVVHTPSHGGILIHLDAAKQYLTAAARLEAVVIGNYLVYEEDIAAVLVWYEHPEWGGLSDREARERYNGVIAQEYPLYFTLRAREGE